MQNKQLKVQIPPKIKSYLPIAFISSIAYANQQDNSWILNNFIQLFIPEGRMKLESFPFQDFMYYDQNEFQVNDMNDHNFRFKKESFVDDIIYWIDHNNYPIVYVDEYEIPKTRFYKKKHKLHSHLVYGYDRDEKEFMAINFLKNNSMDEFQISFDVLENAFFSESTRDLYEKDLESWNSRDTYHRVVLIRYLTNRGPYYDHGINFEYIKNELKNYYLSVNSSDYTCYFTGKLKGTWGMDIYAKVVAYMQEDRPKFDYRIFHMIYEHKFYMLDRLKRMEKNNEFSSKYEAVVENADVLRMMAFKYNYVKNEGTLTRMIELLDKIRDDENNILYQMLNEQGMQVERNQF